MAFQLARTLCAHLAAVAAKYVRSARTSRPLQCAAQSLEDRRLLSAATGPNIVTPFETAVEFQQVGVVFDFEAHERPVQATIDLGNGAAPQDLLLDFDASSRSGTAYAALGYARPGDYTVTLKLVGADGWTSSQSFPVTASTRPDEPITEGQSSAAPSEFSPDFGGTFGAESMSAGPTVQAVFVDSTAWVSSFRSYLASHSLGDSGYKVPDGTNQLKDLSWLNLNQLKVRFSENVTVIQSDLLLAGARTPSYVTSAFAYDAATSTATWTLPASLLPDKLLLQLPDTITSVATGEALDGEWTNGADSYNSGDGTAGGDFAFNLNVLPGDVNQSGAVNSTDTDDTRNRQNTSTTVPGTAPNTYSVLHDVNGSGSINALDTSGVRGQEGSTFGPTEAPQGPPANAPATGFPTAKSDYLDDMYTWGAQLGTAYHGTLDGTAGVTGDTLKYTLVGAPRHGSITTVDANGNTIPPEQFDGVFYVSGGVPDGDASYVYIPHLNYEGVDMFTWKVTDVTDPLNPIDSHPASVVFEVTRQPLFANDDYYIAFLDYNGKIDSSVLYHTLLTNDFGQPIVPDPTYDHRTVTILNGGVTARNGSVMLLDQGNFVYTPPSAGWYGRDTFTYTFTDTYTNRVSNVATVVLDVGVSAGDYSPVAYNRNATPMVGVSHDGNLWRWWHDTVLNSTGGTYPNLDWLFDNIISPYSYGVSPLSDKGGSVSHSDAAIIYTPPALYAGWDSFTASVDAANGGPATPDATQKAWVHVDNQVPQAYAMEFSTAKGVTLSDGVTAYDPDPEGVPKVLTFRLAVGPSHGKIVFRSDGSFDYTPDPDFVGIDRFTYLANDRIADGGLATVLLEVTGNPSADLLAHRTGDRLGQAVFQSVEDSGDPTKYLVLTNNDFEEGLTDGQRDFFNDTANISLDDDLAKIKLRKIPSDPNISSVEVQLSDPGAVRLFKSDGTLLYKEGQTSSEALTLYLNSPSGYFAPLLSGDV